MGLSTARLVVKETCQAIIDSMKSDFLKTPSTTDEWLEIAKDFKEKWVGAHIIGALDGKHVKIVAPPKSGSVYFNYKEFYSIVLLAVANAHYEFPYVHVGTEERVADGGIWLKSELYEALQSNDNPLNIPAASRLEGYGGILPYYLVMNDAFRLSHFLMKPFPGYGNSRKQRIYNYRISRCHCSIENTFGIMSSRFRLLQRAIEVHPNTA